MVQAVPQRMQERGESGKGMFKGAEWSPKSQFSQLGQKGNYTCLETDTCLFPPPNFGRLNWMTLGGGGQTSKTLVMVV